MDIVFESVLLHPSGFAVCGLTFLSGHSLFSGLCCRFRWHCDDCRRFVLSINYEISWFIRLVVKSGTYGLLLGISDCSRSDENDLPFELGRASI
jgi:hypothetical protein